MPVPSSYNDITQDRKLRDFVGWVWYDKQLYVSKSWKDADKIRAVLRIESCSYYCIVVCLFIYKVFQYPLHFHSYFIMFAMTDALTYV